jgi:hypothetical protein
MRHLPTIPKVSRMDNESFVLYKYRAINKRLIESLINQTLYFARPDELNDPFDCRIDLQKEEISCHHFWPRRNSLETGDLHSTLWGCAASQERLRKH